jgi:hypothetical protein
MQTRVKVNNEGVIRSFTFELPTYIEVNNFTSALYLKQLQHTIMTLFSLESAPVLSYRDEENEVVCIGSDQELITANAQSLEQSLHIILNYKHQGQDLKHQRKRQKIEGKIQKLQEKLDACENEKQKDRIERKILKIRSKMERHEIKEEKLDKSALVEQRFRLKLQHLQSKVQQFSHDEKKMQHFKEKIDKVIAKKNEKEIKFLAKQEKKEQRMAIKKLKAEQRQVSKEERKRQKQDKFPGDYDLSVGWPANVQRLYLDGNNMLFVPKTIREATLKDRNSGETILSDMARQFGEIQGLSLTRVFYDSTTSIQRGDAFVVSSAKPQFATSDDALVDVANQAVGVNLDSCLFVTSDRELIMRLRKVGATVIKPNEWFKYAFTMLNVANKYSSLDEMLQNY